MADGITCVDCHGRIDEQAFAMKRRASERLKQPYTPPRRCSDCVMVALLTLALDDEDAAARGDK